jgi:DnaK suppressor protein
MHYFTIEQREKLQASLAALAELLRREIAEHMLLPNHNTETDDAAVADLETSLEVAALERATRQLRTVDAALDRLHQPEFGLCEDCYAEIPYARLSANPAATRCIACQKLAEKELAADPAA